MSEKRFIVFPNNVVWDNQFNEVVCRCIIECIGDAENVCQRLNVQQDIINRLQRKCFELEKDYLIETSDISDKIYLEDEIKKLKKEYGVIDDD